MSAIANSAPDGIHIVAEFFGCCPRQVDSIAFWEKTLAEALDGMNLQILNRHFYRFAPLGVTGYLLLSASHVSIHTWPEHGYVACDVFSCSAEEETKAVIKRITDAVRHERNLVSSLRRGYRLGAEAATLPVLETVTHCRPPGQCPAADEPGDTA